MNNLPGARVLMPPLQVHILDAGRPESPARLIHAREEGLEYFVEHREGQLLIMTNAGGALNNCLMTAPCDRPAKRRASFLSSLRSPLQSSTDVMYFVFGITPAVVGCSNWQLLVPEREGVALEDLDVFQTCLVLWERHRGLPGVSRLRLDNMDRQELGKVVISSQHSHPRQDLHASHAAQSQLSTLSA